LLLSLALGACHTGWNEDPLNKYSKDIQEGKIPAKKPAQENVPKNSIFIDSKNFYEFEIGIKDILAIGYRVTLKDAKVLRFEIENLQKVLPGAKFDPKTNIVEWEPARGFIEGNSFHKSVVSNIVLEIETSIGTRVATKKPIEFFVRRSNEGPKIVSINNFPSQVNEGQRHGFFVTVEDYESLGGKTSDPVPPQLVLRSQKNDMGSALILVNPNPNQISGMPHRWQFQAFVDVIDKEITNARRHFTVSFRAINQFGAASKQNEKSFWIYTNLSDPHVTWDEAVVFIKNKKSFINFSAYDPKNEGNVTLSFLTNCSQISEIPTCRCTTVGKKQNCTIAWEPNSVGTQDFNMELRNRVSGGVQKARQITRKIRIASDDE